MIQYCRETGEVMHTCNNQALDLQVVFVNLCTCLEPILAEFPSMPRGLSTLQHEKVYLPFGKLSEMKAVSF